VVVDFFRRGLNKLHRVQNWGFTGCVSTRGSLYVGWPGGRVAACWVLWCIEHATGRWRGLAEAGRRSTRGTR